MKNKTIKVDYLARVEGEGALYVKIKGDKVAFASPATVWIGLSFVFLIAYALVYILALPQFGQNLLSIRFSRYPQSHNKGGA